MRIVLSLIAALALAATSLDGQTEIPQSRFQVTRAELQDTLAKMKAYAESDGYSNDLRERYARDARLIEERLATGDFRPGDRIALDIQGQDALPDTVVVQPGTVLILPGLADISLAGVLRSELQAHLKTQLARDIRPDRLVVTAKPMVRMQVDGQIGTPGFYMVEADILLSDLLMRAGGQTATSEMTKMQLLRGEAVLLEGDEVTQAMTDGLSLDQLNVRAGDRLLIPEKKNSLLRVGGRWVLVALSTLLLGIRMF